MCSSFWIILFITNLIFDSVSWFLFGGLSQYSQSKPFRTQIWWGRSLCFKSPSASRLPTVVGIKVNCMFVPRSTRALQPSLSLLWLGSCRSCQAVLLLPSLSSRGSPAWVTLHLLGTLTETCTSPLRPLSRLLFDSGEYQWHFVYLLVYLLSAPTCDLKYRRAFIRK